MSTYFLYIFESFLYFNFLIKGLIKNTSIIIKNNIVGIPIVKNAVNEYGKIIPKQLPIKLLKQAIKPNSNKCGLKYFILFIIFFIPFMFFLVIMNKEK